MNKDFLPIILGSDENAYGTARLFREEYDVIPLLLCTRQLIPTMNSKLFNIECISEFDNENVFPSELLSVLKREEQSYDKLIVVPCSDYYSGMLAKFYDRFEGLIANRFISFELLSTLDTKDKFYGLCDKYGLDFPKTYICEPDDRLSAVDKLGFDFPIVVKPENSNAVEYLHCNFNGKKKVFFFADREEYLAVMTSMNDSGYRGKLIIQEFIEGDDASMRVLNSYSDDSGKVLAMCLGQPVLEEYAPKTIGNYAAIISRYDRTLMDRVKAFLEAIGYVGFANFDMKYDKKTGRYMMFEINPRLGRSSFFVRSAGFNMMKALVDDVVYGAKNECYYVNSTALWSNVPQIVLRKYVKNTDLRSEIFNLIAQKKYSRTLVCKNDMNLMRSIRVARYYFAQYKNFKNYYFDKEGKTLSNAKQ